jgi:hypothetical protein
MGFGCLNPRYIRDIDFGVAPNDIFYSSGICYAGYLNNAQESF